MALDQGGDFYARVEPDLHIYTSKGRKFFLANPTFDIEEIAHATAMQCRYTGHVRRFYSVAEHLLLVARLMEEVEYCKAGGGTPFEGLMHDAHEAYISDVASPWKSLIPQYKEAEKRVEGAMRHHYGLPAKISEGVKRADWIALFVEAQQILVTPERLMAEWKTPDPYLKELARALVQSGRWPVDGMYPMEAEIVFLDTYDHLKRGVV